MILYPAIDIRGGRCVRLVEGDFNRETVFDADPAEAAARWAAAGAEWLHVVDLDGSLAGKPVNVDAVRRIREVVDIPIELGGGLREESHLDLVFDLGVSRAILGTALVQSPAIVSRVVQLWGGRIAAGLDARDGKLATRGWLDQSEISAREIARELEVAGVRHLIFTDIRRDGTLTGPNLDALSELIAELTSAEVIASGGVGSVDDLIALNRIGAAGAIVGRALYDGRVDLATAIRLTRRSPSSIQENC